MLTELGHTPVLQDGTNSLTVIKELVSSQEAEAVGRRVMSLWMAGRHTRTNRAGSAGVAQRHFTPEAMLEAVRESSFFHNVVSQLIGRVVEREVICAVHITEAEGRFPAHTDRTDMTALATNLIGKADLIVSSIHHPSPIKAPLTAGDAFMIINSGKEIERINHEVVNTAPYRRVSLVLASLDLSDIVTAQAVTRVPIASPLTTASILPG